MAAERFHAVGKRKKRCGASLAETRKRNFHDQQRSPWKSTFARELDRLVIKQPLELTDTLGKYDISVNVRGGESRDSRRHPYAISRALLVVNPDYRLPCAKQLF